MNVDWRFQISPKKNVKRSWIAQCWRPLKLLARREFLSEELLWHKLCDKLRHFVEILYVLIAQIMNEKVSNHMVITDCNVLAAV